MHLIAFDSDKAQQAVQELSKLLRYVLYDNQQTYVPLGKEVDFIRNYIELMRIRLSSNVQMTTQIRYSAGQSDSYRTAYLYLVDRECFQAWHLPY